MFFHWYLYLGNHVFAVVAGKEDYLTLKIACSEIFKEINDLIEEKKIQVIHQDVNLDFYLSGDYKVHGFE